VSYAMELEREFIKEGELVRDIADVIIEVAMRVAEPRNATDNTNVVAVSRNDGIADYIFVHDKMFRAPWRTVFPVLLKRYDTVVIDWVKMVRKEKVMEEMRKQIEEVRQELAKLAKRKSKQATELKEILQKDIERLTRALNYLM
jgi:glutamyl-tRNA reductase